MRYSPDDQDINYIAHGSNFWAVGETAADAISEYLRISSASNARFRVGSFDRPPAGIEVCPVRGDIFWESYPGEPVPELEWETEITMAPVPDDEASVATS